MGEREREGGGGVCLRAEKMSEVSWRGLGELGRELEVSTERERERERERAGEGEGERERGREEEKERE